MHQLLGAVKELQERSLIVEGLTWHRVFVSDTLSLRVLPDVAASLVPSKAAVLDVAGQANLQQLTTSWVKPDGLHPRENSIEKSETKHVAQNLVQPVQSIRCGAARATSTT